MQRAVLVTELVIIIAVVYYYTLLIGRSMRKVRSFEKIATVGYVGVCCTAVSNIATERDTRL
jgi:hypothetical protein